MKKVGRFEKVSFEQFGQAMEGLYTLESARELDGILSERGRLDRYRRWWQKILNKSEETAPSVCKFVSESEIRAMYLEVALPTRATTKSAGYDFRAPFDFTLEPGAAIRIPTGIRVKIEDGWWLACLPRSSLGFKYRAQLDNTVGVIDGDYYYSDNEGHIFLKITNDSRGGQTMTVKQGGGIMQGIFLPYGVTHDDAVTAVRNGGFGSTNTKKG